MMDEKVIMKLDLTDCKFLQELHQRIKTALDFPDYYGENWDAFWDSLRFECPAELIQITGEHTVSDNLKSHLITMHECLQQCKEERARWGDSFDFEIIN